MVVACKETQGRKWEEGGYRALPPSHAEQKELKPLFLSGPVFFITRSHVVQHFMRSGWAVGYKDGVLPSDGHASRRSQFAPVIFYLNYCTPDGVFFFKRIFLGEAAWKILLKISRNAPGRGQ